jgi:hypothetical protein
LAVDRLFSGVQVFRFAHRVQSAQVMPYAL